jgi:hypothetical protein
MHTVVNVREWWAEDEGNSPSPPRRLFLLCKKKKEKHRCVVFYRGLFDKADAGKLGWTEGY